MKRRQGNKGGGGVRGVERGRGWGKEGEKRAI